MTSFISRAQAANIMINIMTLPNTFLLIEIAGFWEGAHIKLDHYLVT